MLTQLHTLQKNFDQRTMSTGHIQALEQLRNFPDLANSDIYEFGTCAGYAIVRIFRWMQQNRLKFNKLYSFDSFIGLPSEKEGLPIEHSWKEGGYSVKAEWGLSSPEEGQELIERFLSQNNVEATLIPGFFNKTLNVETVSKYGFKPACFVNMDCDLYSSCKEALEFLSKFNLIVPGTVIYYDDWFGVEEYKGGESLAHLEWVKDFNINGHFIFKNPAYGTGFVVK